MPRALLLLALAHAALASVHYCTSPVADCPCDNNACSGGSATLGLSNWCTTALQQNPSTCDYKGVTTFTGKPWAYCAPCPTLNATTCINCPDFAGLLGSTKLTRLLSLASAGAYNVNTFNMTWPSVLGTALYSMDTTFDRYADVFPTQRIRYIHAHGALVPITWSVVSNPLGLTGVYASGSTSALLRLSLAGDPANGVSPGFAIKFLIDGQVSANIIGMYSLDTQGQNYNFFFNQLKTRIPTPSSNSFFTALGLEAGLLLFQTGATPATQLNPDQPAYYASDGTSHSKPKAPQALYLVPNLALTSQFNNSITVPRSFLVDLASIPSSTLLYTVYATLNATACDQCNGAPCSDIFSTTSPCQVTSIATITTSGSFVASPWVDQGIFFQHSRVNPKVRSTCTYPLSQDDTQDDSSVLPTVAHQVADCEARAKCPFAAVASSVGCPRDTWNGSLISFTSADVIAEQIAEANYTLPPSFAPTVNPTGPTIAGLGKKPSSGALALPSLAMSSLICAVVFLYE